MSDGLLGIRASTLPSSSPPRKRSASASSQEKETLLHHLLPDPHRPRSGYRAAASAVIFLFVVCVLWKVLEGEAVEDKVEEMAVAKGTRWRGFKEVFWGVSVEDGRDGAVKLGKGESWRPQALANETTTPKYTSSAFNSTSLSSNDTYPSFSQSAPNTTFSFGSFNASVVDKVAGLVTAGGLSDYIWHVTDPSFLNMQAAGEGGRLIVIGDVHGQVEPLSLLIDSLKLTAADTLFHTGDLVSKASVENSVAAVKILRELGAKGVRGNHDQKVIEWRRFMESWGPLDAAPSLPVAASDSDDEAAVDNDDEDDAELGETSHLSAGPPNSKGKAWSGYGAPAVDNRPDPYVSKHRRPSLPMSDDTSTPPRKNVIVVASPASPPLMRDRPAGIAAIRPKRQRTLPRGWGWGWNKPEEEEEIIVDVDEETPDVEEVQTPIDKDDALSTGEEKNEEFVQSLDADQVENVLPLSAVDNSGSLVDAPGWEWLGLSRSEVADLGVEVPKVSWEWGGEHFQIARALSHKDMAYLADLPLTMWIEGLRSYLVHAGMVPWKLSPSLRPPSEDIAIPDLLESTSLETFTPPSSTSRLLTAPASSLLLVPQNTDPYTLLNVRGLRKKRKGWSVTSKPKGKDWSEVWEEAMKAGCAGERGCEKVGIVYGHWAGKGLDVKEASIGLDSACAAGHRLSALVIPTARNASSPGASSSLVSDDTLSSDAAPSDTIDADAFRSFKKPSNTVHGEALKKVFPDEPVPSAVDGYRSFKKPSKTVHGDALKEFFPDERSRSKRQRRPVPIGQESVQEEADADEDEVTEADEHEAKLFSEEDVVFQGYGGWILSVPCGK